MVNSTQPDAIQSAAIAGAAISLTLLDALIVQGFLKKEAALGILADAQHRIAGRVVNPNVKQATLIISGLHQRLSKS